MADDDVIEKYNHIGDYLISVTKIPDSVRYEIEFEDREDCYFFSFKKEEILSIAHLLLKVANEESKNE